MKIVTAAAVQKAIGKPLGMRKTARGDAGKWSDGRGKLLVISRPTCIGLVGFGLRIGWRWGLKGQ